MSALSFEARVDPSLAYFLAYNEFLRFTSGTTPADCTVLRIAAILKNTSTSIDGVQTHNQHATAQFSQPFPHCYWHCPIIPWSEINPKEENKIRESEMQFPT